MDFGSNVWFYVCNVYALHIKSIVNDYNRRTWIVLRHIMDHPGWVIILHIKQTNIVFPIIVYALGDDIHVGNLSGEIFNGTFSHNINTLASHRQLRLPEM